MRSTRPQKPLCQSDSARSNRRLHTAWAIGSLCRASWIAARELALQLVAPASMPRVFTAADMYQAHAACVR
jgi:hypothetical protein